MKIYVEHVVDVAFEVAVTLQEMSDGGVAVTGLSFRHGDLFVIPN